LGKTSPVGQTNSWLQVRAESNTFRFGKWSEQRDAIQRQYRKIAWFPMYNLNP
jgi:hypothetical protein